ncbi:MAG: sugar phosphate isomerase/epimerase family protein [Bacteroidales bacterium]
MNKKQEKKKLCLHTITTKPWNIQEAAKKYTAKGVGGITVWRNALEGRNIQKTGQMLRDEGLSIVSLCRGGFFPNKVSAKRKSAIEDNLRAIDEATSLGTNLIVLVCGADPSQSLDDSRKQIEEGIRSILPQAEAAGIKLAIEPLHPMFADSRSAINTLQQANDMVERIGSKLVGVAIDVYHLWWDTNLKYEIERSGKNRSVFAFHVCDWKTPTVDMLNDRGLMGEGCIPIKKIRNWVEDAGFSGFIEVEIFSDIYWKQDQDKFLEKIIKAYHENV